METRYWSSDIPELRKATTEYVAAGVTQLINVMYHEKFLLRSDDESAVTSIMNQTTELLCWSSDDGTKSVPQQSVTRTSRAHDHSTKRSSTNAQIRRGRHTNHAWRRCGAMDGTTPCIPYFTIYHWEWRYDSISASVWHSILLGKLFFWRSSHHVQNLDTCTSSNS